MYSVLRKFELHQNSASARPTMVPREASPERDRDKALPPVGLDLDFASRRFETLERISKGFVLAGRPGTRRTLHEQLVHGRSIVLAQDVGLHLTWREDTIFVKPLPAGLQVEDLEILSKTTDSRIYGFLQTYLCLIRHPVDLQMALDLNIMPWKPFYDECSPKRSISDQWDSWNELREMIEQLGRDDPNFVPHPRYKYGELRISRLNLVTALARASPWEYFFHAKSRHLEYWSSYTKAIILVFAFVSILLNGMQVARAPISFGDSSTSAKGSYSSNVSVWFQKGCRYTGYITVILTLLFILLAVGLFAIWIIFNTMRWAFDGSSKVKKEDVEHRKEQVVPAETGNHAPN